MTHPAALARLDELVKDPAVVEYHELLASVQAYEAKHHPITLPTLAQAMRFRREQIGETVTQIAVRAFIHPTVWKWLESDDFELTLETARKLHSIGIPADVLLQAP